MSEELISSYDIRGTDETGLTIECAWNVGKAVADWLPVSGSVVVTYLPTHAEMARAVVEGLRLQGRPVVDGGNGDKEAAKAYIATAKLAGGIVIGFDNEEKKITIEVYQHESKRVDIHSGLNEIRALVEAGNFVPSVQKGELTHIV